MSPSFQAGRATGSIRSVARLIQGVRRASAASASTMVTGTRRTSSPGASWPIFQRSAAATTAGHTKPPRLGPSGPRITGMSPVMSSEPMA